MVFRPKTPHNRVFWTIKNETRKVIRDPFLKNPAHTNQNIPSNEYWHKDWSILLDKLNQCPKFPLHSFNWAGNTPPYTYWVNCAKCKRWVCHQGGFRFSKCTNLKGPPIFFYFQIRYTPGSSSLYKGSPCIESLPVSTVTTLAEVFM